MLDRVGIGLIELGLFSLGRLEHVGTNSYMFCFTL